MAQLMASSRISSRMSTAFTVKTPDVMLGCQKIMPDSSFDVHAMVECTGRPFSLLTIRWTPGAARAFPNAVSSTEKEELVPSHGYFF